MQVPLKDKVGGSNPPGTTIKLESMKIEDYIKSREPELIPRCECKNPIALMLTYERPGLLIGAVNSFLETTKGVPLHVFDDGSDDRNKQTELNCIAGSGKGVEVHSMLHKGFAESWLEVLRFVKKRFSNHDSVITLEDDVMFAHGWLDILQKMQGGIADMGYLQGMTTCFRPHDNLQSPLVDLRGVKAYQSMAHTFHVNLFPMVLLDRFDVLEKSVEESLKSRSKHGIDVYWVGNISHRLNRVNFISEQSWVAHVGFSSMVKKQGYTACLHGGINPVKELERFAEGWKN